MPTLLSELIPYVLSQLHDPKDIYNCMNVNQEWHYLGHIRLLKSVKFCSLQQRQRFFEKIATHSEKNVTLYDSGVDLKFKALMRQSSQDTLCSDANSELTSFDRSDLKRIISLDFGLDANENSGANNNQENTPTSHSNSYGSEWEHFFVSGYIQSLILYPLPSLQSLNLVKCQYFDSMLHELLYHHPLLTGLDLSYSSLRNEGLRAVANHGKNLKWLGLDGLFRLRRNDVNLLFNIIDICVDLKVLSLKECHNVDDEMVKNLKLRRPGLTILL